jgi:hypothetical protein
MIALPRLALQFAFPIAPGARIMVAALLPSVVAEAPLAGAPKYVFAIAVAHGARIAVATVLPSIIAEGLLPLLL